MKVMVNAEPLACAEGATLADLLAQLRLPANRVVVEHNRGLVRQEQLSTTVLKDGDGVEIVQMMGGG